MVKKKKKFKDSKKKFASSKASRHERYLVAVFFIFILFAVLILFSGMKNPLTGFIVSNSVGLDKTNYRSGQSLEGTATLKLESQDILPSLSSMDFFILSSSSKCPLEYVCQDEDNEVSWYSELSGQCTLSQEDPEGECCKEARTACKQVIWNKDFDASLGLTGRWKQVPATYYLAATGIEPVAESYTESDEVIEGNAVFLDSVAFKSSARNASLIVNQDFTANRAVKISHFKDNSSQNMPGGGTTYSCNENDGGRIYTVAGTCNQITSQGLNGSTQPNNDECVGTTNNLTEFVCMNNICERFIHNCSAEGMICSEGKCVSPIGDNGSGQFLCHDTDAPVSWPDLYGDTKVFLYGDTKVFGSCAISNGVTNQNKTVDSCIDNSNISEAYCINSSACSTISLSCGANYFCNSTSKKCERYSTRSKNFSISKNSAHQCSDGDGQSPTDYGLCQGVNLVKYSDRCVNDSYTLEYYCKDATSCGVKTIKCPPSAPYCDPTLKKCISGPDINTNEGTSCSDPDIKNIYAAGTCTESTSSGKTIGAKTYRDYCVPGTNGTELYATQVTNVGVNANANVVTGYGIEPGPGNGNEMENGDLDPIPGSGGGTGGGGYGGGGTGGGTGGSGGGGTGGGTAMTAVTEYFCQNNACRAQTYQCPSNQTCVEGKCIVSQVSQGGEAAGAASLQIDALRWSVAWQQQKGYGGDYPCAFEVVVKGINATGTLNKKLHYYYKLNNYCSHDANNATEKYIDMIVPGESTYDPYVVESMIWDVKAKDLYANWITKTTAQTDAWIGYDDDTIVGIQLVSHARTSSSDIYGQKVWFDYFIMAKPGWDEIKNCTALGKKCCLEGTGTGDYFGDQLDCENNYECWSSCSDSKSMNLMKFIQRSDAPSKYNKTDGLCQAMINGTILKLTDYCDSLYAGNGYSACSATTGTCSNWANPNTYNIELGPGANFVDLKTPTQNGTYSLVWRYSYLPLDYNGVDPMDCGLNMDESCRIIIFEKSSPFTVGSGTQGNCTPNWVIVNTSSCISNTQTVVKEDLSRCPQNAPDYRQMIAQACTSTSGCTPNDYQCSDTVYQQCSPDGASWITILDCSSEGKACDVSQQGCYNVCEPYCEGVSCNGDDGCGGICSNNCSTEKPLFGQWYFWVIVVAGLVVVFIILALKVFKKKGKSDEKDLSAEQEFAGGNPEAQFSNPDNAEIISYIKDAMGSGASKQDVKAKLLEAGWPEDSINEAFKETGF